MILLIHQKASNVIQIIREAKQLIVPGELCKTFWKLAEEFPEELIVWIEKDLHQYFREDRMKECFEHDLVMSSYAVKTKFLSGSIGYIDQMPFVNLKRGIKYPTWRMSSDVGGIRGKTLLEFQKVFGDISDFDYLLNSVAKVGQQNGLFCYSDPHLIDAESEKEQFPSAGNEQLLSFVYQHYKSIWTLVLFFCLMKYEKQFPVVAFFQSLLKPKFYQKDIDLSGIGINNYNSEDQSGSSVDVIIPTLGRAAYVRQVVKDLSLQSLLPKKLIIVEQQPEKSTGSELQELLAKKWPFQILHIFTHKTGACMARNKALERIESDWIFFADDDIRLEKEVLSETLKEAARLKVGCINLNCKQPGEGTTFHKIKQWGSFGSGTSVVRNCFVQDLQFSKVFEHGYGEDSDFGMKLREKGCDIIYHPELKIQHLKAPVGGFRKKPVLAWEKEKPQPKPSPTVMIFAKKYYTKRQMKGFKMSLYLKYFRNQQNWNPFSYLDKMERSWKRSEDWAERLTAEAANSKENRL